MKYQEQLEQLLINNPEINEIFAILRKFHLGQAYLCAGSIRTLVWNSLMQRETNLKLGNLDIFYNAQFESAEEHQVLTTRLNQTYSKFSKLNQFFQTVKVTRPCDIAQTVWAFEQ